MDDLEYIYNIHLDESCENVYGCGGDGLIFRYNLLTKRNQVFIGHKQEVWNIFVDSEKGLLYSAGYDRKLIIFNLDN